MKNKEIQNGMDSIIEIKELFTSHQFSLDSLTDEHLVSINKYILR